MKKFINREIVRWIFVRNKSILHPDYKRYIFQYEERGILGLKLRFKNWPLLSCSAHKTGPGKCFENSFALKITPATKKKFWTNGLKTKRKRIFKCNIA